MREKTNAAEEVRIQLNEEEILELLRNLPKVTVDTEMKE